MHSSLLVLFGLFFVIIITSNLQPTVAVKTTVKIVTRKNAVLSSTKKRKATTKKISKFKAALLDELVSPDIELGSTCYDSCYPNSTFLDSAGKIKNASKYGVFTDKHCGKTYLFGKKTLTWEENWRTCCSIGMTPIIFDTSKESDCLASAANSEASLSFIKGQQFWAGGYQHGLNNLWYWCTKDSPEHIESNLVNFFQIPKEEMSLGSSKNRVKTPIEDYDCVFIDLTSGHMEVSNTLCDLKNITLACESVEKYPEDLLPDKKCKAKCDKQNCAVNKTLFTSNNKHEQQLKDRYTYGRWVSRCGRYFLFSNQTATYDEARQKCCSYGTNLLSMKTDAKRKCMVKVAIEYLDTIGDYWTSGTDEGCDGNYRWCSVDRAFLKKEIQWGKKEPKKSNGDCVWMRMSKTTKSASIFTGNCEKKRKYICEVRQSGTTVEAVQRECIELLGLTANETKGLRNTSNYNYRMKCYLRCIGDNLGMIINGTLQEGNVMRLMEKSNEKSDLDKGYDAIEDCKHEEDPNDNCESAYKMYKCGNEKAPVIFGKMVFWEEVHSEKKAAPVEIKVPRTCDYLNSATIHVDTSLLGAITKTGKSPEGGNTIPGWNNKLWYKSQYSASHSYEAAYVYCKKIGMRLPIAATNQKFQFIYDLMNGATSDNFYMETQSLSDGTEKWCIDEDPEVPKEISVDQFRQLSEPSILVSKKDPLKRTLTPILKSQLATSVTVNHFYCEPNDVSIEE